MDKHRKTMGDYGDTNSINQNFLDHINGVESRPNPKPIINHDLDEVVVNLAIHYGTCKLCKIKGAEETPYHVLLHCPYTWRGRTELFRQYEPTYIPHDWDPASLVQFYARYNLEELS